MRKNLTRGILALFLLGCVAGCGKSKAMQDQDKCVLNMEILEDTLRSYHLVHGLSPDNAIDPSVFMKEYEGERAKEYLVCPSSGQAYAPFSYRSGARCPSHAEHTKALDQIRKQGRQNKSPDGTR